MNILVTGANGQLGNEMRIVSKDTNDSYTFTDVVKAEGVETTILDITDADAVRRMVKEKDIQCIVNCAAYTNVDKAESDEALCRKLNADAPKILAEAMKEVNGLLIQISTDYVFGGDPYNTPCREDQKGTPTGVYGKTKLEGEKNIEAVGCDYVIIRTAWLYSEYGKNFVKTIVNAGKKFGKLEVVNDQCGNPTNAVDLAHEILQLCVTHEYGLYHCTGEGICSWYDFASEIIRLSGVDATVAPCTSEEYKAKHPESADRPKWSALDNRMLRCTVGNEVRDWKAALACFFEHWDGDNGMK